MNSKLSIFNSLNEPKINALFIFSTVFLFPIIALINYTFEIQNGIVSQTYRFFNLTFALYLIAKYFSTLQIRQLLKINSFKKLAFLLFILFWIFYLLRIFFDIQFNNLQLLTNQTKNYYYQYSIGVTSIPLLAVITMKNVDYNFLEKNLFHYLKLIILCFLIVFIIDKFFSTHLVGRFTVSRNGFDYLDSISIALFSSLLLIISASKFYESSYNYFYFFLGCFILLSTAARGAILFTIITILFLIFYRKNDYKMNYLSTIILISLAGIVNYITSLFFKNNFSGNNILLYRINHVASEDSNITRLKILKDAFAQFIDQPLFGSHFLVIESKMYAHNIVLDALISTGLLGTLLLLPILLLFFKNILNKSIPLLLVVLGVFYFLNTLTSGAFYNTAEFWIILVLVVNYNSNNINLTKTEIQ